MNNKTVEFRPITITAETLGVLSKEKNYANLLALYMVYVEIATWQKGTSIKATRSFICKRINWGEHKYNTAKARLIELGLIENKRVASKDGKVDGWYVTVHHYYENHLCRFPEDGFHQQMVSSTPSTIELKESTIDYKLSTIEAPKEPTSYGKPEINELFSYWKDQVGYPIGNRIKQNRNACNNLVKRHGTDKVKQLIDGVVLSHNDRYAPSIADFEELQEKLNKLVLWGRKKGSQNVTVIS